MAHASLEYREAIRREVAFPARWGGRCMIGHDHDHPNINVCFDDGHTIIRIDRMTAGDVRFQHGDNPEHSLVIDTLTTCTSLCFGFEVDEWVASIHERASTEGEGR